MSSSTAEVSTPLFGRLQCPHQTPRFLKLDDSYWTNQPGTTSYLLPVRTSFKEFDANLYSRFKTKQSLGLKTLALTADQTECIGY